MENFQVIKTLGKCQNLRFLLKKLTFVSGEGAFSTVYKVKRISDGQEYALKKVRK